MFDHSNGTNLQAHQTYSVRVPATSKTTLLSQVAEDITNVRVLSTGMKFKLALVIHEGLKLSFASFNHRHFLPPTLNQAVQELSKEKEGGMFMARDYYLWAKAADALSQLRTSGDSR